LERACVMTIVGKLKPASVADHVAMNREIENPEPKAFDHLVAR
jgi:hypothetical protein